MSKGGNFVSEAVLYFKLYNPSIIKTQTNGAPFLFWERLGHQACSECFFDIFRGKTKMN